MPVGEVKTKNENEEKKGTDLIQHIILFSDPFLLTSHYCQSLTLSYK